MLQVEIILPPEHALEIDIDAASITFFEIKNNPKYISVQFIVECWNLRAHTLSADFSNNFASLHTPFFTANTSKRNIITIFPCPHQSQATISTPLSEHLLLPHPKDKSPQSSKTCSRPTRDPYRTATPASPAA